jgi:azurin
MKRIFLNLFTIFTITALVACGGDAKKTESSNKENTAAKEAEKEVVEEAPAEEVEKEIVEINLVAKGEDMTAIAYEPKSLSVPAGSRVKLTFENQSSAAGMYHNFVLVNLGTGQEVATAGIQAGKENDFVPDSDNVLVYTKMLEMGTSVTIEFDAPAKGSYHYICTYPGHYPNMIGRLNVE